MPEPIISKIEALRNAIESVVVGADETVRLLTVAALCGGHILLEDLPGSGKTTLVKAFAKASGCQYSRIQGTPDLMPADLTGFTVLQQTPDGKRTMEFRKGPVFTQILLADEINRMAPRTQSGLLECMAEGQVTCDGVCHPLPNPFLVIATQNPIELNGTFPLPEAQLDRFFMRLSMGTPTREQEIAILQSRQTANPLDALKPVWSAQELYTAQAAVRQVRMADEVMQYLLDLVDATRRHPQVRYGLSTRAALALRLAAQGYALTAGRDYVEPDDVKAVMPAVCAHRLTLSGALLANDRSAEALIAELLRTVEVRK